MIAWLSALHLWQQLLLAWGLALIPSAIVWYFTKPRGWWIAGSW